jgi:hypothetical protein
LDIEEEYAISWDDLPLHAPRTVEHRTLKGTIMPLSPQKLKVEKNKFLDRYNADRTIVQASWDAVNSASQHNRLYAHGVSDRERCYVRERWRILLEEHARHYIRTVRAGKYETDIESLKRTMNERFGKFFATNSQPKRPYDSEFRISHAQKSLSVFLKHLWCMDKVETPPQCPIDARILQRAGGNPLERGWTYVNTIEDHRRMVAHLKKQAEATGMRLAEWELIEFQQPNS